MRMKDSYSFPVAIQFDIDHTRQPVFIAATCGGCLTVCVTFNHEWTEKCKCSNNLTVFGGLQYPAYTVKSKKLVTEHVVYADDDFETVRKYAFRGTRGKDGKNKLEYVSISNMSDGHIANTLEYGGAAWHLKLLARELQYRYENKFKINDNGEIENY
jgi:hypothetical protein